MKLKVATTASDCIDTLPNGVYSVSVLDVLSFEEERYNNTAVTVSSLIIINKTTSTSIILVSSTTSILIPTTSILPILTTHITLLGIPTPTATITRALHGNLYMTKMYACFTFICFY